MSDVDTVTPISAEQDGRILTGVGVTVDSLESTMERHAPPEADDPTPPELAPSAQEADPTPNPSQTAAGDRNPDGTFKKLTRGQKRFEQLTGEREAEKRRADAAERERDELRQQLTKTAPSAPQAVETPARESLPAATAPHSAEPDFERDYESKVGETYATYGAAVQAFNRDSFAFHQTELDARIRTSIEADRASRTRQEHVATIVARGRAAFPDFDAVLNAPHMQVGNWSYDKIEAIAALEAPEHIQYALGKDPALAERLRTADPVRFGMELARLMPSAAVASPASTGRTMVPTPPAPYQPVAGGGSTTVPSSAELAQRADSDFDRSGYRERRARERGVKSRW